MRFAPRPENDFAEYIHTYYRECRYRFERVDAIAGKWTFRDLIPGMSDFDVRLICTDPMTADDWCRLSSAVGEAHMALCRRRPGWWRNLEHLPGVNLTWRELTGERWYYPEYHQWSFYDTESPARVSAALEHLAHRPWDEKDEYFHLKKFCLYYGRYNRSIDPPVNLGVHENKYALHSRLMHYFAPPMHSAVCILLGQNIPGKFEALQIARRLVGELPCWEMMREILSADYEVPKWYEEPNLTRLEDELERALRVTAERLRAVITLVPAEAGLDIAAWKQALERVPLDPAMRIFENAKFSRLMKGRLWFYANAPREFDTTWLIRNELGRIGKGFFHVPFATFWEIRTGEKIDDPIEILDQLAGNPLTDAEVEATREFHRLTSEPCAEGRERQRALAIARVFDGFLHALTRISEDVGGAEW